MCDGMRAKGISVLSYFITDYDVSDDLSLHIQPMFFSKENATGLSLSFNL